MAQLEYLWGLCTCHLQPGGYGAVFSRRRIQPLSTIHCIQQTCNLHCRRQVAAEELGCQVEQLRLQLEAARAGAAAQQDVADLWQRKHAQLEGRVADLEVQLERDRQGREQAETAMVVAQGRAGEADTEARVFKQVGGHLTDSDGCSGGLDVLCSKL